MFSWALLGIRDTDFTGSWHLAKTDVLGCFETLRDLASKSEDHVCVCVRTIWRDVRATWSGLPEQDVLCILAAHAPLTEPIGLASYWLVPNTSRMVCHTEDLTTQRDRSCGLCQRSSTLSIRKTYLHTELAWAQYDRLDRAAGNSTYFRLSIHLVTIFHGKLLRIQSTLSSRVQSVMHSSLHYSCLMSFLQCVFILNVKICLVFSLGHSFTSRFHIAWADFPVFQFYYRYALLWSLFFSFGFSTALHYWQDVYTNKHTGWWIRDLHRGRDVFSSILFLATNQAVFARNKVLSGPRP